MFETTTYLAIGFASSTSPDLPPKWSPSNWTGGQGELRYLRIRSRKKSNPTGCMYPQIYKFLVRRYLGPKTIPQISPSTEKSVALCDVCWYHYSWPKHPNYHYCSTASGISRSTIIDFILGSLLADFGVRWVPDILTIPVCPECLESICKGLLYLI